MVFFPWAICLQLLAGKVLSRSGSSPCHSMYRNFDGEFQVIELGSQGDRWTIIMLVPYNIQDNQTVDWLITWHTWCVSYLLWYSVMTYFPHSMWGQSLMPHENQLSSWEVLFLATVVGVPYRFPAESNVPWSVGRLNSCEHRVSVQLGNLIHGYMGLYYDLHGFFRISLQFHVVGPNMLDDVTDVSIVVGDRLGLSASDGQGTPVVVIRLCMLYYRDSLALKRRSTYCFCSRSPRQLCDVLYHDSCRTIYTRTTHIRLWICGYVGYVAEKLISKQWIRTGQVELLHKWDGL